MASMPIYAKNLPKSPSSEPRGRWPWNLAYSIGWVLKFNQICSNDDTGLTMTIFMTWSNLFHNASAWVKAYSALYSKLVLIQHILCTQMSNTGPYGPLVMKMWLSFGNLKVPLFRIFGTHIDQETRMTSPYMWTPPDGHEGDMIFISGRLRSASGRLFYGIFNMSFQAFFNKIRKEF